MVTATDRTAAPQWLWIYYASTGLLVVGLLLMGVSNLAHAAPVAESMSALGLPGYVITIVGAAKLVAVLGIVQPRSESLRQWAYAGLTFLFMGAVLVHVLNGDPPGRTAVPLIALAVVVTSLISEHRRRIA